MLITRFDPKTTTIPVFGWFFFLLFFVFKCGLSPSTSNPSWWSTMFVQF